MTMSKTTYPPRKVIAVDVDETLIIKGRLNTKLVEWIKGKKADGCQVNLWSARGSLYAWKVAEHHDITYLFDSIHSKPGIIVDDQGWLWIKFVKVIKSVGNIGV